MNTLIVRSYVGEADLESIAHLLNICAKFDRIERYYSVSGLRAEYAEPGFDPVRDLRLWEDAEGQLIAIAELWVPEASSKPESSGWLMFHVHPHHRDRGLEFDIIAWGEVRMQALATERGLAAKLYLGCREDQRNRRMLYEVCGYELEREFFRMARSLAEPVDKPEFPNGFRLSHSQGVADAAAWVEAHNESFNDHWGSHPITVAEHSHWLTQPDYQPELDLVAIAPDGKFAAFCFCHIDIEDNQHRNCLEGGIHILGTRHSFRRRGLGRAMLLAGLQKLQEKGMKTALLGVDAQNSYQAQKLYESVGFRKLHAKLSFAKRLE
ncbi:MAG: GNAT family N-acetyltransferase [Oscillatoriophycideae cyanobacterium NC_groundwater_1537_Pr4_S-0.65um_50_18]|nr:GNAT family N-acetyltransferase [Oscillatoriophycideae cyanobacterium NC_groundwater_1537_Pr4_S-0.65um_50_18]